MKLIILLFLFEYLIQGCYTQSRGPIHSGFGVVKEDSKRKKAYVFKTGLLLKVRTKERTTLESDTFDYSQQWIVLGRKDTIALKQIAWIRGSVYGNQDRKLAGVLMGLSAWPIDYLAYHLLIIEAAPWTLLIALPAMGLSLEGMRLSGTRKFRQSKGWQFKPLSCRTRK